MFLFPLSISPTYKNVALFFNKFAAFMYSSTPLSFITLAIIKTIGLLLSMPNSFNNSLSFGIGTNSFVSIPLLLINTALFLGIIFLFINNFKSSLF